VKIIIEVTDLTNVQAWLTNVRRPYNGKGGGHHVYSRDETGSAKGGRVAIKSIMVEASPEEQRSLGNADDGILRTEAFTD
jgi:hypothetical protein